MSPPDDNLFEQFKDLLIDIGFQPSPPKEDGNPSVSSTDVSPNKLFLALLAARRSANGAFYRKELTEKWEADADKIAGLIGAVKDAAKDAVTFARMRSTNGLTMYEIVDTGFNPARVTKLCEIPERFLDDSVKKNAGGTRKAAALEPEFAFKVIAALTELHDEGINARIVSGYRTLAAQLAAAKTNSSAAGGNDSNHRFGRAIDLTPEGKRTNPRVVEIMKKHGLRAEVPGEAEDNHWSLSGH